MMRAPAERVPVEQPEVEPRGEEDEDDSLPPAPDQGGDDVEGDADDVELPIAETQKEPDEPVQWPSLAEYQEKWDKLFEQHSKSVPGEFGSDNLVPDPVPQLWQNVPHVPFAKLQSDDSQGRLSRCRPVSGMIPAHMQDGVVQYAHHTGEVNFRRRHPLQLASTLGFVLNNNSGKFLGLNPEERASLHEVLTWLRQPGNNALCRYVSTAKSWRPLMRRVNSYGKRSSRLSRRGVRVPAFARPLACRGI